jgi:hypothetical protein
MQASADHEVLDVSSIVVQAGLTAGIVRQERSHKPFGMLRRLQGSVGDIPCVELVLSKQLDGSWLPRLFFSLVNHYCSGCGFMRPGNVSTEIYST